MMLRERFYSLPVSQRLFYLILAFDLFKVADAIVRLAIALTL